MRVAIQGEAGSNSEAAAQRLLDAPLVVPCTLSAEVFERLTGTREADVAVLPIENSLHGAVADHYDLLLEHAVQIVAEQPLRIRHALLGVPGGGMEQVRQVLSHPVALSQCRRFFAAHPAVQAQPFYDTAGAVREVMQRGDTAFAAIAAPGAAAIYGAQALATDLEDDPQNFTRFLLLSREEDAAEVRSQYRSAHALQNEAAEAWKMSVAFAIQHHPGSLVGTLQQLAERGADLTRIESRPVPGKPWEYVFFVDLRLPAESPADTAADGILRTLEGCTSFVRMLGRYPAAAAV